MSQKPQLSRGYIVSWALLYISVGWVVAHYYLHFDGNLQAMDWFPQTKWSTMVDQTGQRPYVGRMLVPMILDQMNHLGSPMWIQNAQQWVWGSIEFSSEFGYPGWLQPGNWPVQVANMFYLSTLIFMLIPVAGRLAYGAIYKDWGFKAGLAGLLLLVMVPMWMAVTAYFYDPMTVLLSTLMIYSAAKAKPWLSIAIFILAALNKETAPLFIPVLVYGMWRQYKVTNKQDDLYLTYVVGFATVVSAAMIQLYRFNHFASNPGTWMEHHFYDTVLHLWDIFPVETIHVTIVMTTMLVFTFIGFRSKDKLLKLGVYCVFAPLALSSVVYGKAIELRALYDAYPILGLLAMPTLWGFLENRLPAKLEPSPEGAGASAIDGAMLEQAG